MGKTWLSGVQCSGSELTLSDCDHNGWGGASFTCYHSINDASVECEGMQICDLISNIALGMTLHL